jgi:nucleoside-diphosphate-sugar epimerase
MQGSEEVVSRDIDSICHRLSEEFGRIAGASLLITGGAGFLGYYFVHTVHHHNQNSAQSDWISLTVFDNYVRGVPVWTKKLDGDCGVRFVIHDLASPLPDDMGDFDYIIHAASIASPSYYRQRPVETMDSNVNGLRALLDHFRGQQLDGKPVGGFLFMSSSEIYGDPSAEWIPTPETYRGNVSCTGPRACYDEAKRYGETLCVNFAQHYGLPIRAARPFNNYGPGLKITDKRVLPDFARDILANQDVSMLSDGTPMRTFCYVADAIVGYYKALVRGGVGEAYNIGTESPEISMADVAQKMVATAGDLFGYKGSVVTGQTADRDYLLDNPNRRCPDISKARSELGYEPIVTLDDGLRRLLVWYAANCGGEDA